MGKTVIKDFLLLNLKIKIKINYAKKNYIYIIKLEFLSPTIQD